MFLFPISQASVLEDKLREALVSVYITPGGDTMTHSLLEDEQVEIEDEDWEGKWNNGDLYMIIKNLVTHSQNWSDTKKNKEVKEIA